MLLDTFKFLKNQLNHSVFTFTSCFRAYYSDSYNFYLKFDINIYLGEWFQTQTMKPLFHIEYIIALKLAFERVPLKN